MKKSGIFVFVLIILAACGSSKNITVPFDGINHQDVIHEWSPHNAVVEWWYLTGYLAGEQKEVYFYQFTVFHGYGGLFDLTEAYALHLSLTDCNTGRHIFHEEISHVSDSVFGDSKCIVFNDSSICLDEQKIMIQARSEKLNFDLESRLTKDPVWHGRNGIISMGHPEKEKENSHYFSFTNLAAKGKIDFKDKQGRWTSIKGRGKSWFDKQWGAFSELGWEWFSFRFFDDEEIMLFSFPRTGHKEGTYVDKNGKAVVFDDYEYQVKKWTAFYGRNIGLGWVVSLPFKSKKYYVEPMVEDQFNLSILNSYWEGICKVFDGDGELVGYCVIETTGRAY